MSNSRYRATEAARRQRRRLCRSLAGCDRCAATVGSARFQGKLAPGAKSRGAVCRVMNRCGLTAAGHVLARWSSQAVRRTRTGSASGIERPFRMRSPRSAQCRCESSSGRLSAILRVLTCASDSMPVSAQVCSSVAIAALMEPNHILTQPGRNPSTTLTSPDHLTTPARTNPRIGLGTNLGASPQPNHVVGLQPDLTVPRTDHPVHLPAEATLPRRCRRRGSHHGNENDPGQRQDNEHPPELDLPSHVPSLGKQACPTPCFPHTTQGCSRLLHRQRGQPDGALAVTRRLIGSARDTPVSTWPTPAGVGQVEMVQGRSSSETAELAGGNLASIARPSVL